MLWRAGLAKLVRLVGRLERLASLLPWQFERPSEGVSSTKQQGNGKATDQCICAKAPKARFAVVFVSFLFNRRRILV